MEGFIGMGSNLGNRWANLRSGLDGLRFRGLRIIAASSVWETEPIDSPEPLWFLNMALALETNAHPLDLLDLLLEVERDAGRRRGAANAPRTLDLDLLALGDLQWRDQRLDLPHPRMWDRRFVLEPLVEIAPWLRNPATGITVAEQRPRLRDAARVFRVGRLEAY